ncbi:hypothetical protein B0H21DRAFT_736445 [Amylocystis lapponica]|nr:hypothetical protein B0H21DRAFT_736445 [Amylocystis lapponica]
MSTAGDDPRDPAGEVPLTFPNTWQDSSDGMPATVMFVCGLIMVSRNWYLAWPAILIALNSWFNQHPLRTKESSSSPGGTLMMAVGALASSYLPMVLLGPAPKQPPQMQVPLPSYP